MFIFVSNSTNCIIYIFLGGYTVCQHPVKLRPQQHLPPGCRCSVDDGKWQMEWREFSPPELPAFSTTWDSYSLSLSPQLSVSLSTLCLNASCCMGRRSGRVWNSCRVSWLRIPCCSKKSISWQLCMVIMEPRKSQDLHCGVNSKALCIIKIKVARV